MHWYFLQEMHFLVLLLIIIILCTELLRLIQLEPLNLETLFKLCCVGLVKGHLCYAFFIFLNFILFKILNKNEYKFSHRLTLGHYDIIIGSLNWLAPVLH